MSFPIFDEKSRGVNIVALLEIRRIRPKGKMQDKKKPGVPLTGEGRSSKGWITDCQLSPGKKLPNPRKKPNETGKRHWGEEAEIPQQISGRKRKRGPAIGKDFCNACRQSKKEVTQERRETYR